MKLLLIILFPVLTYSQVGAMLVDQDVIPYDKQLHFVGGFMINTISQPIYEQELGLSKWGSIGMSLATTGLVATIKELSDKNKTGFEAADITWTMAGAAVSVSLILIIN